MKVIGKIFSGIWTIVKGIIIVVLICVIGLAVSYKKTGTGIGYINLGGKQSLIIGYPNKITTFSFGEKADTEESKEISFQKKDDDEYFNLTNNERVVYNAVLQKSLDILENGETNTNVTVNIDNMTFQGIENAKTYEEIRNAINDTVFALNFKKVYDALHLDYEYLMWWEYDMSWKISEPFINMKAGRIENSYFTLSIEPVGCYSSDTEHISNDAITKARMSYKIAQSVVEENNNLGEYDRLIAFKKYIINNANYDNSAADLMLNQDRSERTVSSRNFINVFDDNSGSNIICGGYANAFSLLCDLSNLSDYKCYKRNGLITVDGVSTQHSWNIIINSGRRYLVDITNSDDSTIGENGGLFMVEIPSETEYNIKLAGGTNIRYIEG